MPSRAAQIAALSLPLDQLPDPLPIPTIEKPFDVAIRPPGSKSITNRALLLAALADGTSELRAPLIDADDAQVMLRAIQQLGAKVEIQRARSASEGPEALDIVRITGVRAGWHIPPGQTITLNLNNAGTATRFLTAAAILAPPDSGGIIIDGDARMRQRPIGELARLLTSLGARVEHIGSAGFPPLRIFPVGDLSYLAQELSVPTTASSQFVSALMLIAPFLPKGIALRWIGSVTSWSYIKMTQGLLEQLDVPTDDESGHVMHVGVAAASLVHRRPAIGLPAFELSIEPDASGATYFWGAAALTPNSRIETPGLARNSLQYDVEGFLDALHEMSANVKCTYGAFDDAADCSSAVSGPAGLHPLSADCSRIPDAAMTLAVLACFASPTPANPTATSTLRGLRTLRVKETDRLAALQAELTKLGAQVEIIQESLNGHPDESLRITPPPHSALCTLHSALTFSTYHDHRMAMSLALIGLRRPNVLIQNPACVAKTYPTFWQDLAKLY